MSEANVVRALIEQNQKLLEQQLKFAEQLAAMQERLEESGTGNGQQSSVNGVEATQVSLEQQSSATGVEATHMSEALSFEGSNAVVGQQSSVNGMEAPSVSGLSSRNVSFEGQQSSVHTVHGGEAAKRAPFIDAPAYQGKGDESLNDQHQGQGTLPTWRQWASSNSPEHTSTPRLNQQGQQLPWKNGVKESSAPSMAGAPRQGSPNWVGVEPQLLAPPAGWQSHSVHSNASDIRVMKEVRLRLPKAQEHKLQSLDAIEYNQWRTRVEDYITSNNHVVGDLSSWSPEQLCEAYGIHADHQLHLFLLECLSQYLSKVYQRCDIALAKSGVSLWHWLEDRFQEQAVENFTDAYEKFQNQRWNPSLTVEVFLGNFFNEEVRLRSLHKARGQAPPDPLIVTSALLKALDPQHHGDFKFQVAGITDVTEIANRLVRYEKVRPFHRTGKKQSGSAPQAVAAGAMNHEDSRKFTGRCFKCQTIGHRAATCQKKPYCPHCKKAGHTLKECRSKKPKKSDQSGKSEGSAAALIASSSGLRDQALNAAIVFEGHCNLDLTADEYSLAAAMVAENQTLSLFDGGASFSIVPSEQGVVIEKRYDEDDESAPSVAVASMAAHRATAAGFVYSQCEQLDGSFAPIYRPVVVIPGIKLNILSENDLCGYNDVEYVCRKSEGGQGKCTRTFRTPTGFLKFQRKSALTWLDLTPLDSSNVQRPLGVNVEPSALSGDAAAVSAEHEVPPSVQQHVDEWVQYSSSLPGDVYTSGVGANAVSAPLGITAKDFSDDAAVRELERVAIRPATKKDTPRLVHSRLLHGNKTTVKLSAKLLFNYDISEAELPQHSKDCVACKMAHTLRQPNRDPDAVLNDYEDKDIWYFDAWNVKKCVGFRGEKGLFCVVNKATRWTFHRTYRFKTDVLDFIDSVLAEAKARGMALGSQSSLLVSDRAAEFVTPIFKQRLNKANVMNAHAAPHDHLTNSFIERVFRTLNLRLDAVFEDQPSLNPKLWPLVADHVLNLSRYLHGAHGELPPATLAKQPFPKPGIIYRFGSLAVVHREKRVKVVQSRNRACMYCGFDVQSNCVLVYDPSTGKVLTSNQAVVDELLVLHTGGGRDESRLPVIVSPYEREEEVVVDAKDDSPGTADDGKISDAASATTSAKATSKDAASASTKTVDGSTTSVQEEPNVADELDSVTSPAPESGGEMTEPTELSIADKRHEEQLEAEEEALRKQSLKIKSMLSDRARTLRSKKRATNYKDLHSGKASTLKHVAAIIAGNVPVDDNPNSEVLDALICTVGCLDKALDPPMAAPLLKKSRSVKEALTKVESEAEEELLLKAVASEYISLHTKAVKLIHKDDLPRDCQTVSIVEVLGAKHQAGKFVRYKCRLAANGSQQRIQDRAALSSPVSSLTTTRLLVAMMALYSLPSRTLDYESAFLNAKRDENDPPICLRPPPRPPERAVSKLEELGVDPKSFDKNYRWLLTSNLYGLCEAAKRWNDLLNQNMLKLGFKQSACDPQMFVYYDDDSERFICLSQHVDDQFIIGGCEDDLAWFEKECKKFEMRFTCGEAEVFCSLNLRRVDGGVILHQQPYVEQLLEKYNMKDANAVKTPMDSSIVLVSNPKQCTAELKLKFQTLLGSLWWLVVGTRIDCAKAVSRVAIYSANPSKEHYECLKRILRYLIGTKERGLMYHSLTGDDSVDEYYSKLWAYCDADFGGDVGSRKSTTGFVLMFAGAAISYRSALQKFVTLSTTSAEMAAACACAREVMFMLEMLREAGHEQEQVKMFVDNASVLALIIKPQLGNRRKNLEVKFAKLREWVLEGSLKATYVKSRDNVADYLTKATGRIIHEYCCEVSMGFRLPHFLDDQRMDMV